MAQTTLNVRIDEDVKKALEEFCTAVGMNTSVAVNMFAKAVIREQRLPFEVIADPFYRESNIMHLMSVKADADSVRNMTVHELIED